MLKEANVFPLYIFKDPNVRPFQAGIDHSDLIEYKEYTVNSDIKTSCIHMLQKPEHLEYFD